MTSARLPWLRLRAEPSALTLLKVLDTRVWQLRAVERAEGGVYIIFDLFIPVQYSDKFMHGFINFLIVLLRSLVTLFYSIVK